MKKYIIIAIALVGALCSCSKEFLDKTPTSSTSAATVFETTDNAALAINGIERLMVKQYLGVQGFNGEGTIKMYYGNYPGEHFFVNLPSWAVLINGTYYDDSSTRYDYYPWYYYYRIIGNANSVIVNIDDAEGTEAERQFIKAQALTFRAYSFMMLAQLYGYSWRDSSNGSTSGLVLRLDTSSGDLERSDLATTYKQIYADLDEAIDLYTKSGLKRSSNCDPDINVAYATYARAALNKQDWATALSMAGKARSGYPLMSNSEYKAGFYAPTSEWIWSSCGAADQNLYYYSYQAYMAYNSSASAVRTYPKCISRELFDQIPDTDMRKSLFLDPTGYSYTTSSGKAGTALAAYARTYAAADGRLGIVSNATPYAYMQFKIACEIVPGVGWLNHFRSSEMVLIEAEANCQLGNDSAAQKNLVELNKTSGRDAAYECTATGSDLLSEIKFYRAVELWGEGFDWFDHKRWGDTIVRHDYANGGNFITALALTITPDSYNRWTWVIPERETDYNDLAD